MKNTPKAIPSVLLYVSENCPLCEKTQKTLENLRVSIRFHLEKVHIENSEELLRRFFDKVPVVEIDYRYLLFYPFDEKELRKYIIKAKESYRGRRIYNRNSKIYDLIESPMEGITFSKLRRRLFKRISSTIQGRDLKILEIGIGTGKNISYYPNSARIFGCDLSLEMLKRAEERKKDSGLDIQLLNMDVQALGFRDNYFDGAVSTFVFCSVADPVFGLKEIRRVLKPGGKLFMLEHIRAENPFWGQVMDTLDPLFFSLTGAHINRRTGNNLELAGFTVKEENLGGVLRIFEATAPAERTNEVDS